MATKKQKAKKKNKAKTKATKPKKYKAKSKGKSKAKKQTKRGRPKAVRTMPKFFYAQLKKALGDYFKTADFDYTDYGSLHYITKLCYARISKGWIEYNEPPEYALGNVDLIFNEVTGRDRENSKSEDLFFQQFVGETYMWWDIRALYFNILCSDFFDKKKDRAFYFDYEIGHKNKFLYENKDSDETYITTLYNEIKHNNRLNNTSPGGYFTIDEDYPYEPNKKGGFDFQFKYHQDNTDVERTDFAWNALDCEERFKERFKSITQAKYKSLKEKKARRLREWEMKMAMLQAKPVLDRDLLGQEREEALRKELEEIKENQKKELKAIEEKNTNQINQFMKAITEANNRAESSQSKIKDLIEQLKETEKITEKRRSEYEKRQAASDRRIENLMAQNNKLMAQMMKLMSKSKSTPKKKTKKRKK